VNLRREYVNSNPMVAELSRSIVEMERGLITQQSLITSHPRLSQEQTALENLKKTLEAKRQELARQKAEMGQTLLDEPRWGRTAHGIKIAQGGAVGHLRVLEQEGLIKASAPGAVTTDRTGPFLHDLDSMIEDLARRAEDLKKIQIAM
jgi:hypothetical protein